MKDHKRVSMWLSRDVMGFVWVVQGIEAIAKLIISRIPKCGQEWDHDGYCGAHQCKKPKRHYGACYCCEAGAVRDEMVRVKKVHK